MADIMHMGEKNPNYLGSFDLYDVPNRELTLTISNIKEEDVLTQGIKERLTACYFSENYKPMILNATNKKRLAKLYGTKDSDKLKGNLITIVIEKVKAFGKTYDALRIKEVKPIAKEKLPLCELCGQPIQSAGNMTGVQVAKYTKAKYGKSLCGACATKQKQEELNNENN